MDKYKGRESELIDALEKKYGKLPPDAVDNGSNVSVAPSVSSRASSPVNVSRKTSLTAEVPEQPAAVSSDDAKLSPEAIRELLVKYYTKFDTEKLKAIDKLMDKYKGRESELIDALEKKYGKLPPDAVDNGSNVSIAPSVSSRVSSPVNVSRKTSLTAEVPKQRAVVDHVSSDVDVQAYDLEQGKGAEVVAISLIEREEEERYHVIELCDRQLLTFTLYTDSVEAGQVVSSVSNKFDATKQFASFSVTAESMMKQDVDELGCFIVDSYIQVGKGNPDDKFSKNTESIGKAVLTMQNIV